MIGVEVSPRSAERFAHCTMISVCLARSHLDFSPNAKRMAPSHESACINRLPSVYQSSVQQKLPLRFGSQGRFQSSSSTPGLGELAIALPNGTLVFGFCLPASPRALATLTCTAAALRPIYRAL